MSFVINAVSKLSGNRSRKNQQIQLKLLEACKNGDIDSVNKCLLLCRNNVNVVNYEDASSGLTPLKYACYYGHYQIVSILLNIKGIQTILINHCGGHNHTNSLVFDFEPPIFLAIIQSHKNPPIYLKIIDLLYQNGADINLPTNIWGLTPLHAAIKYENVEIFKYLISKPYIDINNRKSRNKWNALHFAAFYNKKQCEIMSILLDFDAISMINDITSDGSTCLHLAIKSWPIINDIQLKKCKLLIKYGADIQKTDIYNKTALDYIKNEEYKQLLMQYASKYVDNIDYLILNKYTKFEMINGQKRLLNPKKRYICDYSRHCMDNMYGDDVNKSWSYYRDLTLKRTQNRLVFDKDIGSLNGKWFMFAIYIKENAINETLRRSLLCNLCKLAQDKTIEYDLRDSNSGNYLNRLSFRFDPHRPPQPILFKQERIVQSYLNKTMFDEYGCIIYTILDDVDGKTAKNTAFIHDLIDPNKNLGEHKLWIPTIFDCLYKYDVDDKDRNINKLIKSPILNLDYVKYKDLYTNIGDIFKCLIQPSFERLLGLKLCSNEKIIVKSMKYILQKHGDEYNGCLHREGLGENIIALSIYYPSITGNQYMENGQLTISLLTKNKKDEENELFHEFEIKQNGFITFYNEGYHQLKSIKYVDPQFNKNDKGPISRTIFAFFLISPLDKDGVPASNDNALKVNLIYYWKYYISYWLRNEYENSQINSKWLNDLVYIYLFGLKDYDRFVYKKRVKMRKEKGKELIYRSPIRRRQLEGISITPLYGLEGLAPRRRQLEGTFSFDVDDDFGEAYTNSDSLSDD